MTGIDADGFNAFERRGWADNRADEYDRVFGPVTRRVIDDLLDAAGVARATRLLDVATGPGYVAARAAARGAEVVGMDLSPQMLEMARRVHRGVVFELGDAESIPRPDATFDAAVANFCLLHVGRPAKVVEELARVLAPGGRVAVTVWNTPDRARLFGVVFDAVRAAGAVPPADIPAGPDFFQLAADADFTELLEGARLGDVRVRTIDFVHRIPGGDHLWRGMLDGSVRTRALLRGQTDETRSRIRLAFDAALAVYRAGAGFDVPVSVKLASGRKR
jgi:ubiquinone/menaquinone biosynthesis C-methylase UbiE